MGNLNKREKLLVAALAISFIALWVNLRGTADSTLASDPDVGSRKFGPPPEVHLELLDFRTSGLDPVGRDLFAYYVPVVAKRPQLPPPTPPTSSRQQATTRADVQPRAAAPRPPTPAFNYIGFLGPKDNMIAVFRRGTKIFLAQIGDVIDGKFKLLNLSHETVVLSVVSGRFSGVIVELTMGKS